MEGGKGICSGLWRSQSANNSCAIHTTFFSASSFLPFAPTWKFGHAITRSCVASVLFHFYRLQLAPHRMTSRQGEEVEYLLESGEFYIRYVCRVLLVQLLLLLLLLWSSYST
ncbi:unnamed protein product [Taenia asiatica]|uniref:Secreted protein n=1 Tax=Taenia asiatica TaxID=60517 RepID=A0A0R3WGP2_TAEAS|nr:unnamed protein product [Taenia asiatica]